MLIIRTWNVCGSEMTVVAAAAVVGVDGNGLGVDVERAAPELETTGYYYD